MMFSTTDFINGMINFFPEITTDIEKIQSVHFEECNTIVIEEVIMPKVIALLKKNSELDKIIHLFQYFEMIACCADDELSGLFSVCCLEILGNEKNVLEIARQYMGPLTSILQKETDLALGRELL